MHSHYCPRCGQALIYNECKKESRWGFTHVVCPRCSVRAEHSGGVLVILGLAVIVGGAAITDFETVGLVIAAGFIFVGVIRLIRQFRRARAYVSTHDDA